MLAFRFCCCFASFSSRLPLLVRRWAFGGFAAFWLSVLLLLALLRAPVPPAALVAVVAVAGALPLASLLVFLAAVAPLFALSFLVRSLFFVRFVSPAAASWGLRGRRGVGFGAPVPSWSRRRVGFGCPPVLWGCRVPFRWACVSPAALARLRRSSLVFAVRPALLVRRSGVVVLFWACVVPFHDKTNESKNTNVKKCGSPIGSPQNPTTTLDKSAIACYITFVATG